MHGECAQHWLTKIVAIEAALKRSHKYQITLVHIYHQ